MAISLLGHAACRRQNARRKPGTQQQLLQEAAAVRQAEIEQDLQLARDLQQGLLLESVPQLPGWEISVVSLPARELGGDLYDFLLLDQQQQGIMIGDVSGKGLPAALRMAVARTVFRHAARRGANPAHTLAVVNREVLTEIPQGMVTMLYAALDLQRGVLQLANAGHNYPILVNGDVHEVEISGLPLGIDSESDYREVSALLGHGDTVVLYTDGVTEALNPQGEMFGYARLEQLLRERANLKPRALVAALLHELRAWSGTGQADDITLVVVRRRLARINAELRSIADDILGTEAASVVWCELPLPSDDAPASEWIAVLPEIAGATQARFGRGLARELQGQLRLALEEYR